MFPRKFTTLHFSNPFNKYFTKSQVIYVPSTGSIFDLESDIQFFDFPVSEDLNFHKTVGDCKIIIETLGEIGTTRVFTVRGPWGSSRFIVDMKNGNLGRLISYFNRVIETNYKELLCIAGPRGLSHSQSLSLFRTVNVFNSGVQLFKLELTPLHYFNLS